MERSRRHLLYLAALAAALSAGSQMALAQAYPSKPVRIIVGYAPGGAGDITGRFMGQWLSERLGQQFVLENRPGAGTNIATEMVVRALPDGYSLLLASGATAINTTLYEKLSFDFIRDMVPIAGVVRVPLVVVVNPTFPAKTIPEFIAYARANPGRISMASAGTGSTPHVAGELFKMMAGIDMVHVPYRGGAPAIADLLGGQVHVFFGTTTAMIGHIRAGRLRALAVTTAARSEALPEIPTIGEFVPSYEASDWFGLVASKAISGEIVDKLNKEIMLVSPTLGSRFGLLSRATCLPGRPQPSGNSSPPMRRNGPR